MKHSKLLVFVVLSLPFLISSCKKTSINKDTPPTPTIVGYWNLLSQSDTILDGSKIISNTIIASTDLYGSINFQSNGTVYITKSFAVGTVMNGTSMFFTASRIIPVTTDTATYTINNNTITFTSNSNSYKDTIISVNNNKLVLLNSPSSIYKTTWNYSK